MREGSKGKFEIDIVSDRTSLPEHKKHQIRAPKLNPKR
jgi:hypothetical protein